MGRPRVNRGLAVLGTGLILAWAIAVTFPLFTAT